MFTPISTHPLQIINQGKFKPQCQTNNNHSTDTKQCIKTLDNTNNTTQSNKHSTNTINLYNPAYYMPFGAMKKSEFKDLDLACVEKFKTPIQNFNNNDDLQKWSKNEIKKQNFAKKLNNDNIFLESNRIKNFCKWTEYLNQNKNSISSAASLVILESITKDLKPNNKETIVDLNPDILMKTINEINKNMSSQKKYTFNFKKLYCENLKASHLNNDNQNNDKTLTKWIKIDSKLKDSKNFDKNVEKLKALSHNKWCTKRDAAQIYLAQGDMHIYYENGAPKIGMRMDKNKICEIQGEKNNHKIPIEYIDVIQDYINEQNLECDENIDVKILNLFDKNQNFRDLKALIEEPLKEKDYAKILTLMGLETKKDENGGLIIKNYENSLWHIDNDIIQCINLNESEFFENIVGIEGDADFSQSKLENLSNLKYIGGNANFKYSKLKDLGNLERIGGFADFSESDIEDLGELKSIGQNANFMFSKLNNLSKLEEIGGDANFDNSLIESLSNLKDIKGNIISANSCIKDIGDLKHIGKNSYISEDLEEKIKPICSGKVIVID